MRSSIIITIAGVAALGLGALTMSGLGRKTGKHPQAQVAEAHHVAPRQPLADAPADPAQPSAVPATIEPHLATPDNTPADLPAGYVPAYEIGAPRPDPATPMPPPARFDAQGNLLPPP